MEILRATKTAEQAGAYYVRIQAMARKHQIPLHIEFDEHDTPETKYIVAVDDYLPVATCRLYAIDNERVMLGRIVVLPEYRHQGLGTLVVREAEAWAKELGFRHLVENTEDKLPAFEAILKQEGLAAEECAYMGDDWPDLPLLRRVGLELAAVGGVADP